MATTIDFEDTPFGTVTTLGTQYIAQGLSITGSGPFSGVAYSEGMFGVQNFGNTSTQVMDIGGRAEPTLLRFVDPLAPLVTLGASSVSFLIGDGDLDSETFSISFFNTLDQLLSTATYTTTTGGRQITETSTTLGSLIGSVRLELLLGSASGAVMDDLVFVQDRETTAVPEPSTLELGLAGAIALRLRRARSHTRKTTQPLGLPEGT